MKEKKQKQQKKHSTWKKIRTFLFGLLVFFSILIALSVRWGLSQFADLKTEEIVYELRAPLQGTGNGLIGNYLVSSLVPAIAGTAVLLLIRHYLSGKSRKTGYYTGAISLLSAALMLTSAGYFLHRIGLKSYIEGQTTQSSFIEDNYADPAKINLTFPEKKRNLIFIYLESMETTYSDSEDGGAFDMDYIPELTALAQENEDFSGNTGTLDGGYSMPGTTWTMAAIMATTSGLPLKTSVDSNSMSDQESFFPGMTTLGDILEDQGYRQIFVLGSDATFGGRRTYYTEHGNFEIRDYNYAIEQGLIPSDYKVFWGYEDEKMFQFSKDTLLELSASDQPFNLTMLTVDTHAPKGYACRLCPTEYGSQYGNALACSSRQTAEFVEWVQQQDFYENTTIVITGDHPTMATGFSKNISSDIPRRTYTCIINGQPADADSNLQENRREYTTFDIFPTSLASIGVTIEGNRLGLGTNLYSSESTLSEQVGFDTESEELLKNSAFLSRIETLDAQTDALVEEFADFPYPGIAVDKSNHNIGFEVTPEMLAPYQDELTYIDVKVWFYDEAGVNIHRDIKLKKREDGSWFGVHKMKDFYFDADQLSYQIYGKTADSGTFKVGAERVINMSDY